MPAIIRLSVKPGVTRGLVPATALAVCSRINTNHYVQQRNMSCAGGSGELSKPESGDKIEASSVIFPAIPFQTDDYLADVFEA